MWGIFGKPLKRAIRTPRSACCTDIFEIFIHFGRCLWCLLPLFVNRQLLCRHTNSHNVLYKKPDLIRDHKTLVPPPMRATFPLILVLCG